MTFDQWLETRPYAKLLSEGTVNLMRQTWEASALNSTTSGYGIQRIEGDLTFTARTRGDVRD